VHDREYYAKVELRELDPWSSWEEWHPARNFRWGEIPREPPYTPDLGDYKPAHVQAFRWILERRRPGGSLPPGNFELVQENSSYRLWRRSDRAPRIHVAIGDRTLDGAGVLDCERPSVARVLRRAEQEDAPIRVARPGARPVLVESVGWDPLEAETELGPAEGFIRRQGGTGAAYTQLPRGRFTVWIQGSFGPGVRVFIGSTPIGAAFGDMGIFDGWHLLGDVDVIRRNPIFAIQGLGRPWWQSGWNVKDVTGPLAFVADDPEPRVEDVPADRAGDLCGERLDWIELV
jgi:hypothetical protein